MEIYKQIPEATPDALSEEDLKEIKEKVKNEDKWGRLTRIREEVMRKIVEKGLRPVNAVLEGFVKRVEELIEWEKLEQIAKEIEETMSEEELKAIKENFEKRFGKKAQEQQEQKKTKEKEQKETTSPPSIEDYYRNELEGLLLKMGLTLGWSRAFEIAEEILKKVKEYSRTMVRGL
jgi:uncharacterized membrane protein YheB (UPF0754 family)